MKTNIIYQESKMTKSILSFYLFSLILFFASCSEDVNEWTVDKSYDRLYRTTHLEVEKSLATSVVLKFNGVAEATK